MKRYRIVTGLTSMLAVLMVGGMFVGSAAAQAPRQGTTPSGPHPVRLAGKVSSVSGNSLVLTTRQGDFTINISANTWIVVEKDGQSVEGSASDLQKDKTTTVAGMTTANANVVDARTIAQGKAIVGERPNKPNQQGRGKDIAAHVAAGTITAINGATITLKGEKIADITVQTTASTLVVNNGFTTVSTLKVGDKVGVFGAPVKPANGQTPPASPGAQPTTTASKTINAWAVRVDNGSSQIMVGRVDAVNGNTLTVRTPKNRAGITVNVNSATGYKSLVVSATDKSASLTTATAADLKVGSSIIFEATPGTDGKSYTAKAVVLTPNMGQK